MHPSPHALRERVSRPPLAMGLAEMDHVLGGGLPAADLHEFHAASLADLPAAAGFAGALACQAAQARLLVWIRQDGLDGQAGRLYPPGLLELGLDPAAIVLVRARDAGDALRASADAARSAAPGAVLVELWGRCAPLDLTASRRLLLAARNSGVAILLLGVEAPPRPSAATTRWTVRSLPSRPLAADAPGAPTWNLALLRHRGGVQPREWQVEWDRDHGCLRPLLPAWEAPHPGPVVPLPVHGPAAEWRRAG